MNYFLYNLISKSKLLALVSLVVLVCSVSNAQSSSELRGMTPEEYALALDIKVDDLDNDTYVKVNDGQYVLDRYDMKPPYYITGDSGVKKRLDLYKLTERATMQDLGMVVFVTDTKANETFNLVIPNLKSDGKVWNMYFDDIHQHDREQGDVALKMSYVLSKELAYLMQKANGADVSAMDEANSDYDFCFPAAAKVTLYDGSQKNIADVQPGDRVVTYKNGKKLLTGVEEVSVHQKHSIDLARVILISEETVTASTSNTTQSEVRELLATPNHPVLTAEGKKSIAQLKEGDVMYYYNAMTQSFEKYSVQLIYQHYKTTTKVYNLGTSEDSYLVDGLVVMEK